jgi:hypothetical protein
MVTFVDIHIYSYTQSKRIGEPIQRAIVHNEDDIPDHEMIYYHVDLLLEEYGIDRYESCHTHDDSGFCIVALFTMNDESCCVRATPCVFPKMD